MTLERKPGLLKHRLLLVDPSGRWTAPLKQACSDLPCQLSIWRPARQELEGDMDPAAQLVRQLGGSGLIPVAVLFHCQPSNLWFLRAWSRAETAVRLPPLIGLIDSPDAESADRLQQLGCSQVHAGFHSWDRLVKTVASLLHSPVYCERNLEELVAANLPWAN